MHEKTRLLLVTWDGGGNTPPELGLARRLVARGHGMRVLADPHPGGVQRRGNDPGTPGRLAPRREAPRNRPALVPQKKASRGPSRAGRARQRPRQRLERPA
jgi:hypothetical protein